MLQTFTMPIYLSDDVIELHARINHDFDADLWFETNKHRLFLRQYLLWVDDTTSLDDVTKATDKFTTAWNDGNTFAYSLVLCSTGRAVGSIDLHNVDIPNYRADIGYWLSEEHNGKGYMSRAVKLIEKQAFSNGLHRLQLLIQKDNTPSVRVAEKNHYLFEGTKRQALFKYGHFYDELIYAKLNNS